jgi:hypothetical protein
MGPLRTAAPIFVRSMPADQLRVRAISVRHLKARREGEAGRARNLIARPGRVNHIKFIINLT